MGETIKMHYPSMEEMAQVFRKANQDMTEIKQRMSKIAGDLEGGVLIGDAGSAFSSGIRQSLLPALEKLCAKLKELDGDITGAVADMRDGDSTAQSRFK
jgi:WXG100 family type VII secretion target